MRGAIKKKKNKITSEIFNFPTFRVGEFTKNQYRGVDCLKREVGCGGEGLGQFTDLRRGLGKKKGCVFEGR